MDVARDLGCLQLDPISVVAKSHLLVLWSRLGPYALKDLDALLWRERRLFEYWAHMASIVLTEDYPIHHLLMRQYPHG
ncbi:MAG TPA: crosslink repair DNA glycosylase YcaQ family protein, partial [Gemmatimonadales bacterium]|nr:crosslink repair DNA glycosylase YcaQ family protein [Gemmatimonadales bacterium]